MHCWTTQPVIGWVSNAHDEKLSNRPKAPPPPFQMGRVAKAKWFATSPHHVRAFGNKRYRCPPTRKDIRTPYIAHNGFASRIFAKTELEGLLGLESTPGERNRIDFRPPRPENARFEGVDGVRSVPLPSGWDVCRSRRPTGEEVGRIYLTYRL